MTHFDVSQNTARYTRGNIWCLYNICILYNICCSSPVTIASNIYQGTNSTCYHITTLPDRQGGAKPPPCERRRASRATDNGYAPNANVDASYICTSCIHRTPYHRPDLADCTPNTPIHHTNRMNHFQGHRTCNMVLVHSHQNVVNWVNIRTQILA